MKKCKDCKRFKPISYSGGSKVYPYCNQEHAYEPCGGVECDYPDIYEPKIKNKAMKVFGCRNQQDFGGGLILVAANDKNEAFLTAAMSTKAHFVFDWMDDDGAWCEPDGNISHCDSSTYPLDKWFEFEHLSANFNECRIIIEDHYTE